MEEVVAVVVVVVVVLGGLVELGVVEPVDVHAGV